MHGNDSFQTTDMYYIRLKSMVRNPPYHENSLLLKCPYRSVESSPYGTKNAYVGGHYEARNCLALDDKEVGLYVYLVSPNLKYFVGINKVSR